MGCGIGPTAPIKLNKKSPQGLERDSSCAVGFGKAIKIKGVPMIIASLIAFGALAALIAGLSLAE